VSLHASRPADRAGFQENKTINGKRNKEKTDKKLLNRVFLLTAAGVLLLLGALGVVRALQPEEPEELVVFTQPEAETVDIQTVEVTPSPSPEPVSYENTVTLLVDRTPVITFASEYEAKQTLWDYLTLCAAAPEGERFISAQFDCELILTQADRYAEPMDAHEALVLLESNLQLVPVEVTAQRIAYAETEPEVQQSTEDALAKGCRIFTQIGTGALTQTITQVTYRAGEETQTGAPVSTTLREARTTILRVGAYTKSDTSGTAQRLDGPDGKDAGDLKLAYPMRGKLVKYFGYNGGVMNNGVEITNNAGTNVTAPGEGLVVYCGERGAYGFVVDIDHGNGFVSRVTHLSDVQVEMNQRVFLGDPLGVLAETDDGSKPVMHYELLIDGIPYNPLHYIG